MGGVPEIGGGRGGDEGERAEGQGDGRRSRRGDASREPRREQARQKGSEG